MDAQNKMEPNYSIEAILTDCSRDCASPDILAVFQMEVDESIVLCTKGDCVGDCNSNY
jgi:hypothetical protein